MDIDSLLSTRSARVIAFARVLLAVFLAFTSFPGMAGEPVRGLILGYLVYTVIVLLLLQRRGFAVRVLSYPLVLQAVDFAVAIALLYSTSGGADTPFFTPMMFLIIAATVQWGSRGTVIMTVIVLAAYLPTGIAAAIKAEGNTMPLMRFILRSGNVVVIATLLWAFGRHVERVLAELSRLSYPAVDEASDEPPVAAAIDHALRVFGAERGALLWSQGDEPRLWLEDQDGARRSFDPEMTIGDLVAWPSEDPVFLSDRRGWTLYRHDDRIVAGPRSPIVPALADQLNFDRALAMRVLAAEFDGWLFVFDHEEPASENLQIGATIAAQASVLIERWRVQQVRRASVAGEERVRLARDLHDGVLQFLAGSALQLGALEREEELSETGRTRLATLRAALIDEQRELRGLVGALRPMRGPGLVIADELTALARRLGRHWGIEVQATVTPADLRAPGSLMFDLTRLMREGVANAVRHGAAKRVEAIVTRRDGAIELAIADDGSGFAEAGRWNDEELTRRGFGPRSLRERARALGGALDLESRPGDTRIRIRIPRKEAA
ncbi:MAG TPA: sensor histidine kinase [Sphingomonas sp.]|nr:sensor histidine kinase [Sphingomonas sp.]